MRIAWLLIVLLATMAVPALQAQQPVAASNGLSGRWQVMEVPNAPWVFEFTATETALSGTIRQSGTQNSPVNIAAGKIDGTTISFKILSPDGERIITFRGRVNGREISLVRQIDVLSGGSRGGNDLYGASAALQFVARRTAQ